MATSNTSEINGQRESAEASLSAPCEVLSTRPDFFNSEKNKLIKATGIILLSLNALLPICFGAVHPEIYLPTHIIAYSLIIFHLCWNFPALAQVFSSSRAAKYVLWALAIFTLFTVLQFLAFNSRELSHPVLGTTGSHFSPVQFLKSLQGFLFFIAVFCLARLALERKTFAKSLCFALLLTSLIVSLIGLSHWFHDNGKLFGYFAPHYVFISERARWPFVNSNNLAHYLLPTFFLVAAQLIIGLKLTVSKTSTSLRKSRTSFFRLTTLPRFQAMLIRVGFTAVTLLSLSLCLAATLSRGSWLAVSCLSIFFLIFEKYIRSRLPKPAAPDTSLSQATPQASVAIEDTGRVTLNKVRHRRRKRRKRSNEPKSYFKTNLNNLPQLIARPAIFLIALLMFGFFIYGQGAGLVEKRIEYGLKYSKDDMRWSFYSDTLPILKENLFLGTGLGTWSTVYPKYMNPLLTDVKPAYLHSDPLQLLSEVGVIGILPVLIIGIFLFWAFIKKSKQLPYKNAVMLLGLVCGLLALIFASCSDFPFRIPAVSFHFALVLAYFTYLLDTAPNSTEDPSA